MDIGENLKALRKSKNVTQKEVAEHIGIKQNTYAQYETNARHPDLDMLVKLSAYFKTSVDKILGLEVKIDADALTKLKQVAKIILKEFKRDDLQQHYTEQDLENYIIEVINDALIAKLALVDSEKE